MYVILLSLVLANEIFVLPEAEPPNSTEALKWLYRSSQAGYVRAQYQLALCFHQGQGVDPNLVEAVSALIQWLCTLYERSYCLGLAMLLF